MEGGCSSRGGAQFSPGSSNPTPGLPFKGRQFRMEAVPVGRASQGRPPGPGLACPFSAPAPGPAPSSPRSSTLRMAATLLP